MTAVSVIIPARNERYLEMTLASLYENAGTDIEVVVVMDGPTQYPLTRDYPNLIQISHSYPSGIRASLNQAAAIAGGDVLLKVDAHCIFGPDFVTTLTRSLEDNQVAVARRYTLELATAIWQPRAVDYYYLSCPWTHPRQMMMQSCPWISKTGDAEIDDLMCFQGSMWMMKRSHWQRLGGLESGMQYVEHHEISIKTWLGGGQVVINKGARYAHPAQGSRGYRMDMEQVYQEHYESALRWTKTSGFAELIERFWPLPTEHARHRTEKYFWPDNWRELYDRVM